MYFTYTKNEGAAFGIGNNLIIICLTFLIFVGIIVYLIKSKNEIQNYLPVILIIAGAIGNFIDRIIYNYVIDYSW